MDGNDGYPALGDQFNDVLAAGDEEAYRSLKMAIKVPPAFTGHVQTDGYLPMKMQWKNGYLLHQWKKTSVVHYSGIDFLVRPSD